MHEVRCSTPPHICQLVKELDYKARHCLTGDCTRSLAEGLLAIP